MQLLERDIDIIYFIANSKQVTARQVHRAIFRDNASEEPMRRALRRLVKQRMIGRIEIRTVGGKNGGSGQYVYQLDRQGWELCKMDRVFYFPTSIHYDRISVTDRLLDIEEKLNVTYKETVPACHRTINYNLLEPDAYIELDLGDVERRVWLEVDEGTEHEKQVMNKLMRYVHAYDNAGPRWNPWPLIVWTAPNEKRRLKLEQWIAQTPSGARAMFRACVFDDLVATVSA